jgi:hypothetical protein
LVTTQQNRLFKQEVDEFVTTIKGSAFTDITGGILQAKAMFSFETLVLKKPSKAKAQILLSKGSVSWNS